MNIKLTRRTKDIIQKAVQKTETTNRYKLCEEVAAHLEELYSGGNLDYQLQRMNLTTTKKILAAIDVYVYKYGNTDKNDIEKHEHLTI